MSIEKVKIAGAGPAGLTAAINLAKAGYQVDVFEKYMILVSVLMGICKDWRIGSEKRYN